LSHTIHTSANRRYQLTALVSLGGFTNIRQEATWQGHTLELDETSYPWGTLYELECETVSGLEGVLVDGCFSLWGTASRDDNVVLSFSDLTSLT
jgi:hypothetical protein